MKAVCITQARMGSTRLPGKVLKKLNGYPVLLHVASRLNKSVQVDSVVVATSQGAIDTELEAFCTTHDIQCFRDSEQNVLERYYKAAIEYSADIIIRVCSDCPLVDHFIMDEMLIQFKEWMKEGEKIDYYSNTLQRTFPRGLDIEIMTFDALKKAYKSAQHDYETTHVTPYIYQNPEKFVIKQFTQTQDFSKYRWTLDTQEDYEFLNQIFMGLKISPLSDIGMDKIIHYINDNPGLKKINSHIQQKSLEDC